MISEGDEKRIPLQVRRLSTPGRLCKHLLLLAQHSLLPVFHWGNMLVPFSVYVVGKGVFTGHLPPTSIPEVDRKHVPQPLTPTERPGPPRRRWQIHPLSTGTKVLSNSQKALIFYPLISGLFSLEL